ncbi:hypothetical protein FA15DRAFT_663746 [Coprinopsis marcescibilis]|uniref:Uncharacterized protein n=1 Tax=Coprinopsis marcescibilis TaxID=230819 RepID=A0A5C3L995_COPMA|nr:hypothetical protein FA15DRAFT_663746 [Coprinopsis marcescibilis]
MAGDKDTLLSMGFDPARVEWALKAIGNRGLQPAMDHILENEGKPVPDLGAVNESSSSRPADGMDVDDDEDLEALRAMGLAKGASGSADAEAKSIKCSQCGKTFKNTGLANYHAEKSGHDQFEESTEEIKPLTEEEKKQKLEELRVKMAEKRARKAEEEAKENRANELIRRKQGTDMNKLKEELKEKEILKEVEAKKREKIEDAKARAAVKAQIEADKKARAEKAAREKALREGRAIVDAPSTSAPAPAAQAVASGTPKVHTHARLQIRMSTGGPPLTTTLPAEAPLRELAEFVASHSPDIDVDNVTFTQNFPRKTFAVGDFSKTLKDLGFVPSAALVATP